MSAACVLCGEPVPDGGLQCPVHRTGARQDAAQQDALRTALESIAANTCCEGCGEAAKVARAALATEQPLAARLADAVAHEDDSHERAVGAAIERVRGPQP